MKFRTRATALALSLAIGSTSLAPAWADPTAAEIAAARELFEDGLKLEEKSDWAGALEKFRKVAAVKTTPQVRFHVALCLENLGKLVDALVEFQRAQSDASAESSAQVVATNSGKHVADLKERIPRVIVKLPAGVDSATVTIDGANVASSLVGTAIPLDPGKHTIAVTAPKRAPFSRDVDLVERGKPLTVDVTLPEAKDDAVTVKTVDAPKPETPETTSGGPGALPWIFGGIGVAALAGSGVFYALRQSTISDLESVCGPDRTQCPDDKRDVADKGKTYTTVGNVLLGVGIVGVATSIVFFVVSPSSSKTTSSMNAPKTQTAHRSSSPTFAIGTGPTPLGIGLSGAF